MIYFLTAGICWLAAVLMAAEIKDPERRWSMIVAGTGFLLWATCYGMIVECATEQCALVASRTAFIGVMTVGPSMFFFFNNLLTDRPTSARVAVLVIAISVIVHLPAGVTSLGIRTFERTADGPVWEYGPWGGVVWAFWLVGSLLAIIALWRHRRWLPWDEFNRLLWSGLILLSWLLLGAMVMGVFGFLLRMHRVMMVVPLLATLPFLATVLIFRLDSPPDLWGWLGRLFPNERSRFLHEFERLESALAGYSSRADLSRDLSEFLCAPVRFTGVDTESGSPKPRLWVAPSGLHRLYSPADRERIERIERYAQGLDDAPQLRACVMRDSANTQLWPAVSGAARIEREIVAMALKDLSLTVVSVPAGMWGGVRLSPAHFGVESVLEITCASAEPPPAARWGEALAREEECDAIVLSVRELTSLPEGVLVELASLIRDGKRAAILCYDGERVRGPVLELCAELGERALAVRLSEQLDREEDILAWMKLVGAEEFGETDPEDALAPEVLQSLLEMDWATDGQVLAQLLKCSLPENAK